eukprot:CCRYP_020984-RA/>CCRYP_020984-RA protein AED:0.67 eAED:0.65 QI:0/0/0/0.5/0/0/2/0/76
MHQLVKKVKKCLEKNLTVHWKLPSRAEHPFVYQIDTLLWMVELGRIDMTTVLASHLAMPKTGHLEAIFILPNLSLH